MLLDIDARCHLHQFDSVIDQAEYRPLGDIEHLLAFGTGTGGTETPLPDGGNKFGHPAFLENVQAAIFDSHLEPVRGECAAKNQPAGILADVHKPAHSGDTPGEGRDIHMAATVYLRRPQRREIEPLAIIEIELRRLIDNRMGVQRGTKRETARRHAADGA